MIVFQNILIKKNQRNLQKILEKFYIKLKVLKNIDLLY